MAAITRIALSARYQDLYISAYVRVGYMSCLMFDSYSLGVSTYSEYLGLQAEESRVLKYVKVPPRGGAIITPRTLSVERRNRISANELPERGRQVFSWPVPITPIPGPYRIKVDDFSRYIIFL